MRLCLAVFVLAACGGVGCGGSAPATNPATDGTGGSVAPGSGGNGPPSGSGGSGQPSGSGGGGIQAAPDGGEPPADAAPTDIDGGPATDGGGSISGGPPARVLIYTLATGYRHDSTPVAADYIARAARGAGLTADISADPAKFTPAGLAVYGGIVLVATSGEPFGPGTTGVDALVAWLKVGGGGLVGIENSTHAYDTDPNYVSLLGGEFTGHPGGFTTATCTKVGDHPSVAMLPASFRVTDEIYAFSMFRMDNQVVLRCADDNRPVSWYREEGAGRVFFTALGHANESWTQPPLVPQHVLPGLLWAMKR